ncbi:hypothetical protein BpHYR1_026686 [Brachionus plicatilis]|uniref:Uncharacterized protein n=1 Tax=Brachionus plicatilis TaxID=10195 RepID=A0A3M7RU24_BRAPC|nr:hypothetical protein BpHYR1_026686 [Brachionus plicatilis]
MEAQRVSEDNVKPLTKEELKIKVNSHPSNSGYCVIFSGKAGAYKTTICDILAKSFGPYHTWPGSQGVERDILKFDDAALAQIDSKVVEEIQWLSVPKKITLDNTPCSIKEQLSGTGLNIMLAKNKSCLDGITLKIERFFMSFNPSGN